MMTDYRQMVKAFYRRISYNAIMCKKLVEAGCLQKGCYFLERLHKAENDLFAYEAQHFDKERNNQPLQPISYTKHGHMVFHPPALQSNKKVA